MSPLLSNIYLDRLDTYIEREYEENVDDKSNADFDIFGWIGLAYQLRHVIAFVIVGSVALGILALPFGLLLAWLEPPPRINVTKTTIAGDECTNIDWDGTSAADSGERLELHESVSGSRSRGRTVPVRGSKRVCPLESTSYWVAVGSMRSDGQLEIDAESERVTVRVRTDFVSDATRAEAVKLTRKMAGKWRGIVHQSGINRQPAQDFPLQVSLAQGRLNAIVGKVRYPTKACDGHWILREVGSQTAYVEESLKQSGIDGTCYSGLVHAIEFKSKRKLRLELSTSDGSWTSVLLRRP